MMTRRRGILHTQALQEEQAPASISININDIALENAKGISLLKNSGGPAAAAPSYMSGDNCVIPEAGSYIVIDRPCYENEALTVEVYMPNLYNGVIISCGGEDTLAAMQWTVDSRGRSCIKRFTGATTAANYMYAALSLTGANRQCMRLERRGSQIKYWVSSNGLPAALANVETRSNVGTSYTAYDAAMSGLGFRTGLVFPSGDVYVASIHWEKLED